MPTADAAIMTSPRWGCSQLSGRSDGSVLASWSPVNVPPAIDRVSGLLRLPRSALRFRGAGVQGRRVEAAAMTSFRDTADLPIRACIEVIATR